MMKYKLIISIVLFATAIGTPAFSQDSIEPMSDSFSVEEINNLAPGSDAELMKLCGNILEPARERRHALQVEELQQLRDDLNARIETLEQRKEELQRWAQKREEFASKAQGTLVEVYAKMPAEAAAERLAKMEAQLSAALIMKLKPRTAAAILSEMPADEATYVSSIMAASADKKTEDG